MKPLFKKSKSVLSKLKQWKPFEISKQSLESNNIFMNFSLRLNSFSALLCDSEQEFMTISTKGVEIDTVLRPRQKMIIRTFLKDFLVEDVTQLSLFQKVIIQFKPLNIHKDYTNILI